jgi:GTP cyclohydrolase IA
MLLSETDQTVRKYHEILGGRENKFDTETIRRVLSFSRELYEKREYSNFTTFDSNVDQMIVSDHLRLFSFCEHHLLPFHGEVAVGYIPDGKILGLSKFQRIVDKLSSKPQLQERLTSEILEFIQAKLNPKGLGIVIKAIHTCVFARGPQSSNAEFTTSAMLGSFRTQIETRQEFLNSITNNRHRM